jgi:hypothetical protein
MRMRSVLQEYEAKLRPVQVVGSGGADAAHGKGEWKVYADGGRKCKVWVSGLDLSDGAVLQLAVSGQQIAEIMVRGGRARYRRESERGEALPSVEVNQVLQVSYAGQIILDGEFYSE